MKRRKAGVLAILILVIALAACGGPDNGGDTANNAEDMNENMNDAGGNDGMAEDTADEDMDEPAFEAPGPPDDYLEPPEVIYGLDGRGEGCGNCSQEVAHPDETLQHLAQGVAMLMRPQGIREDADTGEVRIIAYKLTDRLKVSKGANMCEQERFADQPAPGFCSAFLVDEQTMMTAGHCIPTEYACENTTVVFDFEVGPDGELAPVTSENVFSCSSIIKTEYDPELGIDYTLFELDRPAQYAPLPLGTVEENHLSGSLAVIGHPSGLPQKISDDGVLRYDPLGYPYFVADLDTFGGNSGSPVIDMNTYTVAGMLLGGEEDYKYIFSESCFTVKICELYSDYCSGEQVMDLEFILDVFSINLMTPQPSPTP